MKQNPIAERMKDFANELAEDIPAIKDLEILIRALKKNLSDLVFEEFAAAFVAPLSRKLREAEQTVTLHLKSNDNSIAAGHREEFDKGYAKGVKECLEFIQNNLQEELDKIFNFTDLLKAIFSVVKHQGAKKNELVN
ncbi:MAG: hypothetical protein V1928_04595 [Parcubacteria group bacterium]